MPYAIAKKMAEHNYIVNDREGIKGEEKGGKEQEVVGVYRGSAGVCHGMT